MPVAIQPGELTLKGHGAILTATIRHDFGPDFLKETFHYLAINDLVDQIGPLVYELIRSGLIDRLQTDQATLEKQRSDLATKRFDMPRLAQELAEKTALKDVRAQRARE